AKAAPESLEQIVGLPTCCREIEPPRIVRTLFTHADVEDLLQLAEDGAAVAGPPRQLAQREMRRLRAAVDRGGAFVRFTGGIEAAERLMLRSDEELGVIAKQRFGRIDDLLQLGQR